MKVLMQLMKSSRRWEQVLLKKLKKLRRFMKPTGDRIISADEPDCDFPTGTLADWNVPGWRQDLAALAAAAVIAPVPAWLERV